MPVDTHVRGNPTEWIVEVSAKTVQPQDEFWGRDDIYIAATSDQTLEAAATILPMIWPNPSRWH